jgi:hypothetical protein
MLITTSIKGICDSFFMRKLSSSSVAKVVDGEADFEICSYNSTCIFVEYVGVLICGICGYLLICGICGCLDLWNMWVSFDFLLYLLIRKVRVLL